MAPLKLPQAFTVPIGQPGINAPGGWLDTWEETAELAWPNNVIVYDRMRRTDGQTGATLRAPRMAIMGTRWRVEGAGVDPRVRAFVEAELGLQTDDQGRRRRIREGISFDFYLRHVLLDQPLGFMPFEQVYSIGPPPAGMSGLPPMMGHLAKLDPRMPRTISRFELNPAGELGALWQWVLDGQGRLAEKRLPIERLVMHVNEREGSDWSGTSILRVAYKHWLLKEGYLRLSAVAADRQSMGLPVINYGDGDQATALAVAAKARSGEDSAVAVPGNMTLTLEGVQGSVFPLLEHIRYNDQAIGRSAMTMFLDLGHDNGARALGDTFLDIFTLAATTAAEAEAEIMTEYAVRDLCALNFGPDEPYPVIVPDPIDASGGLTADALGRLADSGVIIPDDDLEAWVRRRGGAPPAMRTAGPGAPPHVIDQPPGPPMPPPGPTPPIPPPTPAPPPPAPAPTRAAGRTLDELGARLEHVQRQLAARRAARRADQPGAHVPAA